jgi:hypothetical protein
MKPPTVNGVQTIAFTGSTPVLNPTGNSAGRSFTIISTVQFDILFSSDGTPNIPDASLVLNLPFVARVPFTFDLGPKNTHFKVVTSGTVFFKYWLGPRSRIPLKPPTVANTVLTTLLASTPVSIPISGGGVGGRQISLISNGIFEAMFADDGSDVNIPSNGVTSLFGTRQLYTFDLGPKNTHLKVTANASSTLKHWLSA